MADNVAETLRLAGEPMPTACAGVISGLGLLAYALDVVLTFVLDAVKSELSARLRVA